jgi:hypothetical protein
VSFGLAADHKHIKASKGAEALKAFCTVQSADAPLRVQHAYLTPGNLRLIDVIAQNQRQVHIYENPNALPRVQILAGPTDAPGPQPQITHYGHTLITISANCVKPCRLVLHDIAYPGWLVSVNGRQAPILTQDGLFRAVDLAAGQSEVEFSFAPLALANLQAAVAGILSQKADQ